MNPTAGPSLDSRGGLRSVVDTLAVEMLRGLDQLETEQPGGYSSD